MIDTDPRRPLPRFARVIGDVKAGYFTVKVGTIVKIIRRDGYAKGHHKVFCELNHTFTNYLDQEKTERRQVSITVDKLKPLSTLEQLAACSLD